MFHSLSVKLLRKAPRSSKVVFSTCSAYCRIFQISVYIKLYFTFTPPVSFQCCQCQICTYIMTSPFDIIKYHIILTYRSQSLSSPLCMKICYIIIELIYNTIIYLIEKSRYRIRMLIFQGNSGSLSKRHLEITVHSAVRNNCHRNRINCTFSCKPATKQISQWTLYRRYYLIIPIYPYYQVT